MANYRDEPFERVLGKEIHELRKRYSCLDCHASYADGLRLVCELTRKKVPKRICVNFELPSEDACG